MIVSQIVSAGLITIAYPFAVFGYALMEEERPPKWFWSVMIKYALFILFMKFIFQLDLWLVVFENQLSTIEFYNVRFKNIYYIKFIIVMDYIWIMES